MSETLNARVIHMHDIEANWRLAASFIPRKGEIIVYDKDEITPYIRLKVGDGETLINDLKFVSDNILDTIITWDNDIGYIDSGRISSY